MTWSHYVINITVEIRMKENVRLIICISLTDANCANTNQPIWLSPGLIRVAVGCAVSKLSTAFLRSRKRPMTCSLESSVDAIQFIMYISGFDKASLTAFGILGFRLPSPAAADVFIVFIAVVISSTVTGMRKKEIGKGTSEVYYVHQWIDKASLTAFGILGFRLSSPAAANVFIVFIAVVISSTVTGVRKKKLGKEPVK
ncbi:hypothetical protein CAPTEDRAFT_215574 [Capitella teleta]|uniref:Uncharacterized protein n=1 Tax=Capitella teleta TaxID=283909 RepID=R7U9G9_CAPTE|nr:hypothetical protein CAPTEDRAFT_215574 [Capitella teleta]|eukprot:ELU02791.1 hypothetical protein CAPTEDRAFT_215574 [Capitella teleta]